MNLKHRSHLLRKYNRPQLFVFFMLTLTIMHAGRYAGAEEKALQPDLLNRTNKTPENSGAEMPNRRRMIFKLTEDIPSFDVRLGKVSA